MLRYSQQCGYGRLKHGLFSWKVGNNRIEKKADFSRQVKCLKLFFSKHEKLQMSPYGCNRASNLTNKFTLNSNC